MPLAISPLPPPVEQRDDPDDGRNHDEEHDSSGHLRSLSNSSAAPSNMIQAATPEANKTAETGLSPANCPNRKSPEPKLARSGILSARIAPRTAKRAKYVRSATSGFEFDQWNSRLHQLAFATAD